MILIPASEVPDLMEALNDKLLALQAEIATTPCPEAREAYEEQHVRIGRMIDRITPIYWAWNETDDRLWCAAIYDLADAAEGATATNKGRNPVFTELKVKMTEEMLP